jgi:hypothetical protein
VGTPLDLAFLQSAGHLKVVLWADSGPDFKVIRAVYAPMKAP